MFGREDDRRSSQLSSVTGNNGVVEVYRIGRRDLALMKPDANKALACKWDVIAESTG